ncbi:hypothetical protein Tco_1344858 [Tanacetum coccineum]
MSIPQSLKRFYLVSVIKERQNELPFIRLYHFTIQVLSRHSLAHSHEEATSAMVKAQGVWVFALNTLTELAQHVTSKNDMLAILRCPQCDPTAIKLDQKIEMNEGYGLKAWEETQEARRIQGSL